jgi:hypothetical protein
MRKKTLPYLIYLIVILVYSFLSILLTKEKTDVFWCGFVFAILAVFISAALTFISVEKNSSAFPIELSLISFSYIYVIIALLVNLIFGKVLTLPFRVFISIHIVCLGLFAIITILLMLSKWHIAKQNDEVKAQLCQLQLLIGDVEKIRSKLSDLPAGIRTPVTKLIDKVAEKIRFSEYSTDENILQIDNNIRTNFDKLVDEINNMAEKQSENTKIVESYVNSILQLVDDRNMQIKTAKSGI